MLEINEKNFPDEKFRKYISNTFDQEKKGYLTSLEVEDVQEIDASFKGYITSIKGIECFPNLKRLCCSNTWVTSLDVSKNTKLEYLNCGNNKNFTSLNVRGATALTRLICSHTGITELDMSMNPVLTSLECSNIEITSLDVSNNPALETLWCNNTLITELDVSKNMKLGTLACFNTGVTSLDVSNNRNLRSLLCFNTGITILDVRNNPLLNIAGNEELSIIKKSESIQDKIIQAKDALDNKAKDTKEVKGKEQER